MKRKRETIQSWIYRILPKGYQFIYTSDTICDSNIMTLAQEIFLRYFVRMLPLHWLIMRKKGDNTDLQFLPNVNQVIYTLDTIYDSNIMTLAQSVLENSVHKVPLGYD